MPEDLKEQAWFIDVDCSKYMARIINTLNKKEDYDELWNVKPKVVEKIQNR